MLPFTAFSERIGIRSKVALTGGLLGLAQAVGLAVLLMVNRDPGTERWDLIKAVFLAVPYGVALASAFLERAAVRGVGLLVAGVSSLAFTALFLMSFGMALLPVTILLFIAAARAFAGVRLSPMAITAGAATSIIGAALLVSTFFSLHTSQDERCWEWIRYPDGREDTQRTERFSVGTVGPIGEPVETPRGSGTRVAGGCVSDIVTGREAAQGLLIAGMVLSS